MELTEECCNIIYGIGNSLTYLQRSTLNMKYSMTLFSVILEQPIRIFQFSFT